MEKYIFFNGRDTLLRIEVSKIAYFQANRNYTNLHLTNGQCLLFTFNLNTMKSHLEESLQSDARHFIRIGRSLIINTKYVFKIDLLKQQLHLYAEDTGKFFSLGASKEALKELKMLYMKMKLL